MGLDLTATVRAGLLPAVDTQSGAGGFAPDPATDLDAAAAVIEFLREGVVDLDCILNRQQNADRLAFTCLIETKLNPAVLYSTWCEWHSAKHLRVRLQALLAMKYAQLCAVLTPSAAVCVAAQCAPCAWPPIQLAPDCRREQTVRRQSADSPALSPASRQVSLPVSFIRRVVWVRHALPRYR
jgi:hypothetical protein